MPRESHILFKKGSLRQTLARATERALSVGALIPIPTKYEFVEDSGVKFFVRVLTSLARKDEERKKRRLEAEAGLKVNPFLPYEKELFVADVSETHVAILNKFNVVERHLLIVTREFQDQRALLTPADFEALWACLSEYESLGFYNGGEEAGASQAHKHLQLVPLPLAPKGPRIPLEPLLATALFNGELGTIPALPFLHVVGRLKPGIVTSPADAARNSFALYGSMLQQVKMTAPFGAGQQRQSAPYCLLIIREWMLLVPRSQEFFEGISINSLGYAGGLLVRNEEQMAILKQRGPMAALKSVALPLERKASKRW
jgi:ATP adenylyltransferase